MNINQLIHQAFNRKQSEEIENVYIPSGVRVASTAMPNRTYSFNEISQHIRKQLTKKHK